MVELPEGWTRLVPSARYLALTPEQQDAEDRAIIEAWKDFDPDTYVPDPEAESEVRQLIEEIMAGPPND